MRDEGRGMRDEGREWGSGVLTASAASSGFTLIEMLVVIGIIVTLMGASIAAYSGMTKRAQQARGRELVANTATALNLLFQRKGKWPEALASEAASKQGRLNARAAACLAVDKLMTLTYRKVENNGESYYTLSGLDRFGIISPWAQAAVKRVGASGGSTALNVPSGGTVEDHILYYALDDDGDGVVEASVGGASLRIRANAAVWCAGMDGVLAPYPYAGGGAGGGGQSGSHARGRGGDDIYSWAPTQVEH